MDGSFEEWARSRTPQLLRSAYLLTGHQQNAEDLVQEALARTASAWQQIERNPDAYCQRAMYRLNVSRWRARRWREVTVEVVPERSTDPGPGEIGERIAVLAALATLSPMQRAVLVLRYYEDRTESDIAQLLGCSPGAVKTHAHRGLRTLRENASRGLNDFIPTDVSSA